MPTPSGPKAEESAVCQGREEADSLRLRSGQALVACGSPGIKGAKKGGRGCFLAGAFSGGERKQIPFAFARGRLSSPAAPRNHKGRKSERGLFSAPVFFRKQSSDQSWLNRTGARHLDVNLRSDRHLHHWHLRNVHANSGTNHRSRERLEGYRGKIRGRNPEMGGLNRDPGFHACPIRLQPL